MIQQTFKLETGRATNGARVLEFITNLPLDRPFKVTVESYVRRRSDQQNRYLWGLVYPTILAGGGEQLRGWTNNDLHEFFLGEHFGWELLDGMGRKRVRPIRHSSKLNKQEFSDYIASIQQKCAEMGIVIPDPE